MNLKVAEIFYSLQGEGRWAGVPSVFLRTFGCNFSCRGFGMPRGEKSAEPEAIAANASEYTAYHKLPLATTGCDSYASWHPAFKHLSPMRTVESVAGEMVSLLPNHKWTQPNGQDIHLVITGGEPLLGWQRAYEALLELPQMQDLKNITFETNATQELNDDFRRYLESQSRYHITWLCSPKLSVSGEVWEAAIKPNILSSYSRLSSPMGNECYLKFVVADSSDLDDVDRAITEYKAAGVEVPVYLMPVGGVTEQYAFNAPKVAQLALQRGCRYSPRLQCDLWRNAWGT